VRYSNVPAQNSVSISTTATKIVEKDHERVDLIIYVQSGTVYLGSSDVSTSNAVPFDEGTYVTFEDFKGELYGVVASGTGEVRVLELKE